MIGYLTLQVGSFSFSLMRGYAARRFLTAIAILVTLAVTSADAVEPFIRPGQRIVFLGDSNTHAGHYIVLLETWLRVHHPDGHWTLINLGLPGETASGLSEPAHPYLRPCIHTRLESALEKTKPDVVVLAYGTNDGIYYPFSEQRFSAYREGITELIAVCHRAGAKIVLLTPPPFDPDPMRKKGQIQPTGAKEYSWLAAHENYDNVMAHYSEWILTLADMVDIVIDIRSPMLAEMKFQQHDDSKKAMLSDGIHYGLNGHRIVASRLWAAWNLTPAKPEDGSYEESVSIVGRRQRLLRDAWLTHVGHTRPDMNAGLPLDEAKEQADKILETISHAP